MEEWPCVLQVHLWVDLLCLSLTQVCEWMECLDVCLLEHCMFLSAWESGLIKEKPDRVLNSTQKLAFNNSRYSCRLQYALKRRSDMWVVFWYPSPPYSTPSRSSSVFPPLSSRGCGELIWAHVDSAANTVGQHEVYCCVHPVPVPDPSCDLGAMILIAVTLPSGDLYHSCWFILINIF